MDCIYSPKELFFSSCAFVSWTINYMLVIICFQEVLTFTLFVRPCSVFACRVSENLNVRMSLSPLTEGPQSMLI